MPLNWNEIVQIVEARRKDESDAKRRMIEVRDRFNGDYVIPLPESKGEPDLPPLMPNLVADGIEITALRAAGVTPQIAAPALDQNKATGVRSIQMAENRRRAWKGLWHHSGGSVLLRRSFRQLGGYGSMSHVVVPDFKNHRARVETRDSLTAYPDERDPDDIRIPSNVAFVFAKTASTILSDYEQHLTAEMSSRLRKARRADEMWDLCEWIDADQIVIGILGPQVRGHDANGSLNVHHGAMTQRLFAYPNRVGRCTAVVGRRVTLDRIAGQMDTMLPAYDLANRIMALEVDSMEKSIYPDRYVLSQDNRDPVLVSGEWKDGREGGMNRITNASGIGYLQSQPSQFTNVVVDRIESAIRQSAGVNALASGLNPGSLRTGRALDSFQGFSIEPRMMEAHDIMGHTLTLDNELSADLEVAYFPTRKIWAFSGEQSDQEVLEYKPRDLWEININSVSYPMPGADINNMTLAAGQMIGAGIGSRRDAMAMHPGVPDPDRSMREIMMEQIDTAILQGFGQQLAAGALPVVVAAKVKKRLAAGMTIEKAIEEADEEVREMQAREAETAAEAAPGMAPGAPVASPAPPAQEEVAPTIGASEEQAGFRELINALRATSPEG